eukprot:COSAG01_NODE_7058_length_3373_cov_1.332010_5_plen_71_part_00
MMTLHVAPVSRPKRELPEALAFEFPDNWESPITDFCTDDTAARDFQQAEDATEQSDAEQAVVQGYRSSVR